MMSSYVLLVTTDSNPIIISPTIMPVKALFRIIRPLIWMLSLSLSNFMEAQIPELRFPMKTMGGYVHVEFSGDGKYILTATTDEVQLWDSASGKRIRSIKTDTKTGPIGGISSSPNFRCIAIWFPGHPEPIIRLWDGLSPELESVINFVPPDAISNSGRFAYFTTTYYGDRIDSLRIFDLVTKQEFHIQINVTGTLYPHPENDMVLIALEEDVLTGKNKLVNFNLETRERKEIFVPSGTLHRLHWLKTNNQALLVFQDEEKNTTTFCYWDSKTGAFHQIHEILQGVNMETIRENNSDRIWIITPTNQRYVLDKEQQPPIQLKQHLKNRPLKPVVLPVEDTESDWDNYREDIFRSPLQFSPSGELLTVMRQDTHTIQVWNISKDTVLWSMALNASHYRIFNGSEAPGGRIEFSPDGSHLLTSDPIHQLRLWDSQTGTLIRNFAEGKIEKIISIDFNPDLQFQLLTEQGWRLFDAHSPSFSTLPTSIVQPVSKISSNGKHTWESHGNRHMLSENKLLSDNGLVELRWFLWPGGDYKEEDVPKMTLRHSANGNEIKIPGEYSWVTTATFSSDNALVLTGREDNSIKVIRTLDGTLLHTLQGHNSDIGEIVISADNQFALSKTKDGYEIKLWNLNQGKELAALFFSGEKDWVALSPEGLFDASPEMMSSMYYVLDREIIDLDQLKERYYEPGLLAKLMGFSQEQVRTVQAFKSVELYPSLEAKIDKNSLDVHLLPRNGGIGKLSLFINGKEVAEDINPQRVADLLIRLSDYDKYYFQQEANTLALRVYNAGGWLKSQPLEFNYQLTAKPRGANGQNSSSPVSLQKKPGLYGIVVGTSDYSGTTLDLQFADRDASLFSKTLKAVANSVFEEQVSVTLLNTDPSESERQAPSGKAAIEKAFADIAAKAKPQDVLVIYFSGHGVNYGTAENSQFYYLTKDIASENLSDPEIRNNYAISSAELTQWINTVPALKQVLILDACNAGKIVSDLDLSTKKDINASQVRALERMKDRTGMFILTGSADDKVSYEASRYGQGLLTYSLLEGMSGLGLTEDKRVDVMTLFQYSRDKVPELARGIGGIQTPILAFPSAGASFDIGIVDDQVSIPIARIKPVFIRNIFQDEHFGDELGLMKALEERLRSESIKGTQAELIYVDVREYEDGYSIKGRYVIHENNIELKARLYKGKATINKEFVINGNKNDLSILLDTLLAKVSSIMTQDGN